MVTAPIITVGSVKRRSAQHSPRGMTGLSPWHVSLTMRQTERLVILGDDTETEVGALLTRQEPAQHSMSPCSERRGNRQALPPRLGGPDAAPRVAREDLMTHFQHDRSSP